VLVLTRSMSRYFQGLPLDNSKLKLSRPLLKELSCGLSDRDLRNGAFGTSARTKVL
jgi:hypothetical protein